MRGTIVRPLLFVGWLLALSPAFVAAAAPQNAILIDWEGAQRQRVDQSLEHQTLPNLQRLIDRGVYVRLDAEDANDSRAAWMEMLTGELPRKAEGPVDQENPPVRKITSIFERLEHHFGSERFITAALIGGPSEPPATAPAGGSPDDTSELMNPPSETHNQQYEPFIVDIWDVYLPGDERVASETIKLLDKYKDRPFFFFVSFPPTHITEPNATLIDYDRWTGRIMDKVAALGLADKTQFYVTGDPGPDGVNRKPGSISHVFLATDNKAVRRAGRLQDIAPTILEAFGLDLKGIEPPLDGVSLTQLDTRPPIGVVLRKPDILYVPTPQVVVDKMLEMAQVKQSDIVYDLGCGDGRIVVTAAKRYGCKAFGYDIDPRRVADSLENVKENGVGDLVTIELRDVFTLDLSGADVVTLYLLPSLNVKLIPQLEKLKPGSRIVSHDFDMRGVEPDQVVEIGDDGTYITHKVYLWTCPLKKTGEPGSDSDDAD